jgi:FkbM family methyltransferase
MSYYSDGAGYEEAQLAQFCFLHHTQSKAQLMQDLLVLFLTNRKKNGYFVEFGASNGVTLSNTMLLEELYGWTGILAEPARGWHKELQIYRQCIIDTRCVTDRSGDQVLFNETPDKVYSTIDGYSASDDHYERRIGGVRYEVDTVSLNDLLDSHGAPQDIDYLSVDTEGSELLILKALDFRRYRPFVITVEHNYREPMRKDLHGLLTQEGYNRKFTRLSHFDDWYVSARSGDSQ